jgi:hypothetical protein
VIAAAHIHLPVLGDEAIGMAELQRDLAFVVLEVAPFSKDVLARVEVLLLRIEERDQPPRLDPGEVALDAEHDATNARGEIAPGGRRCFQQFLLVAVESIAAKHHFVFARHDWPSVHRSASSRCNEVSPDAAKCDDYLSFSANAAAEGDPCCTSGEHGTRGLTKYFESSTRIAAGCWLGY